jgi:hypothetical protein
MATEGENRVKRQRTLLQAYAEDRTRIRPGAELAADAIYTIVGTRASGCLENCLRRFGLVLVPPEGDGTSEPDTSGYYQALNHIFPGAPVPGWESLGPLPPPHMYARNPIEPTLLDRNGPGYVSKEARKITARETRSVRGTLTQMAKQELHGTGESQSRCCERRGRDTRGSLG